MPPSGKVRGAIQRFAAIVNNAALEHPIAKLPEILEVALAFGRRHVFVNLGLEIWTGLPEKIGERVRDRSIEALRVYLDEPHLRQRLRRLDLQVLEQVAPLDAKLREMTVSP